LAAGCENKCNENGVSVSVAAAENEKDMLNGICRVRASCGGSSAESSGTKRSALTKKPGAPGKDLWRNGVAYEKKSEEAAAARRRGKAKRKSVSALAAAAAFLA
jgi:hypothetical protein